MIKFEAAQPRLNGPRAVVYEFARKYRLSDKEAKWFFLKLAASATQETVLAAARLSGPEFKISAAESRQS
jgi:hypothetical protein